MNEIKINKQEKSITIINNGIAFSQFGIAKEILDLVDNQQQEIERLNNIISEIERLIINHNCDTGDIYYKYNGKYLRSELKERIMELVELKENK